MGDACVTELLLERDRELESLSEGELQTRYLTPKTVEVHLTNAYRKLNIGSRRELPAALAS